MTPGDVRARMRSLALSVRDVEAGDRVTRRVLDDLLGPPIGGWGLDHPYGHGGVSTCAMVAIGLLRWLGVDCPAVRGEYRPGAGLDDVIAWARALRPRSAWITPEPIADLRPGVGDVVQLLSPMHVLTVVDWTEAGHAEQVVSIDGGQLGARGLQAIHRCTRPWRYRDGRPYLGARPVDGWLAIDMLPYVIESPAPVR
jgi:hypothetical protein